MSAIPVKDLIYIAVIILCIVGMAWWHHDAVLEGEAKCRAQQQAALEKQHIADVTAAQDVIDGLNQDKTRLQAQLDAKPAPVIRKCGVQYYAGQVPAGTSTARAQPGEPAVPDGNPGMPAGSDSGDVGPGVQAIATAGQLLAIYYQRLYQFTVKTR